MPDPLVHLNESTVQDPWSRLTAPSPLRPVEQVIADVRAAAAGAGLVVLAGADPGRFPALDALVAAARGGGAVIGVEACASTLDPLALVRAGVELVIVPLHGDAAAHDAAVGPGRHAATMAFLAAPVRPRVRVRVGLGPHTGDAVRVAAPHAEQLWLDGGVPGSTPDNRASALDAAWSAARGSRAGLVLIDADTVPDTLPGPVRALDDRLLSLRLQGGWLPGLSAGVSAPAASASTRATLYALGMPDRGAAWDTPVDGTLTGRVRVVVPYLGDSILACATLPRLVRALVARGVDAHLDSVWSAPINVHDAFSGAGADGLPTAAPQHEQRRALAHRLGERFLASVDLSDTDVVVAPGWRAAHALWSHPTRQTHARLVVIDLHLEDGLALWTGPGPWDPAVTVVSCFPAFVGTYLRAGVPIAALRWMPYPIPRDALPPPSPGETAWLAAGNQRRDDALLQALAGRLPASRPLVVLAATCPPLPVPHRHLGTTSPSGLAAAVGAARAVILPVRPSAHDAAGITVAALAMATGTPVVGTRAWGLVDHVPPDAGFLVPATPDAFLDALHVLDDPQAHTRAALAARCAGDLGDLPAWAGALATGRWPRWPARP